MSETTNILILVLCFAIAVPIILLISAVLLRAGVSLYNRFAGGPGAPTAVPEPSMKKSILIVLAVALLNYVIGAILRIEDGMVGANGEVTLGLVESLLFALSLGIGLAVMAIVLKFALPTPFGRALGVSVCHTIVCVLVAVVVVALGVTGSIALSATM